MRSAPLAINEKARLEKLKYYEILDTVEEEIFNNVVKLASQICETPIALISLIDENRQWFKAKYGLSAPETPRDIAFCAHAILEDSLFEIQDSRNDERFIDNPLAVGDPNVIFYAGHPLTTPDNLNIGTLCVIDNKPKKLNEKQKESLAILAKQVVHLIDIRVKTKELEESRRSAAAANESKLDFIAAISHDIRNPLNSLFGLTDILLTDETKPEKIKYLNQFRNSTEVILRIVNDTIELSQLETKGEMNNQRIFSLDQTLVSLKDFFTTEAQRKGIQFEFSKHPNIKDFYFGDQRKIEKILWNLTSNAFKFTYKGAVKVSIGFEDFESSSSKLEIIVEDTGPGINEEIIPNLFKKYVSFSPKEVEMVGSGLGLSIVDAAVKSLGGHIEVISQKDVGSKFIVHLQLQPGPSDLAPSSKSKIPEDLLLKTLQSKKALVADDNEMNRKILLNYLKPFGMEVAEVDNGISALAWINSTKEGIVFLDIEMPGKSGIEVIKETPSEHKNNLYFIACTGLCLPEEKEKIKESGFQYHIPKPYTRSIIKETLHEIISETVSG
ncbi:MAG: ATP-binding protein [Leptospira sp.]|nr:ATP-binding protein [Leptospira sp.]